MKKGGKIIRTILTEGLMVIAALLIMLMMREMDNKPAVVTYQASGRVVTIPELRYLPAESLLNSGDVAALDELPGIGEVLAGRIIETRERDGLFKFPEDVMTVKGIGEKRFEDIMAYLAQAEATPTDLQEMP